MAKNRIHPRKVSKIKPPAIDLRRQEIMCKALMDGMRESAIKLEMQVSGQAAIESKKEKLMVCYSCFPNGDFMVWFLDMGYYSLMALVNQNFRHVVTLPADEQDAFQVALSELVKALGK